MSNTKFATFSGHLLDFADMSPASICISDIAHGLSHVCRFAGQVNDFYSVAQHSTVLSLVMPGLLFNENPYLSDWQLLGAAKAALLHDASEAYTSDLPSPLKAVIPEFIERVEGPLTEMIFEKFDVSTEWLPTVAHYDKRLFMNEAERFTPHSSRPWMGNYSPINGLVLNPMSPIEARRWFYQRFKDLFSDNHKVLFDA